MRKVRLYILILFVSIMLLGLAVNAGSGSVHFQNEPLTAQVEVDILAFKVKLQDDFNEIRWISLKEKDVQFYILERADTGGEFKQVAKIRGAVDSEHIIRYEVKDEHPLKGALIYRLKVLDSQGDSVIVGEVHMADSLLQ